MIYLPQLDTHSVIEIIPVYKYEFSPEMSGQSSLSQIDSAGSVFSNAGWTVFKRLVAPRRLNFNWQFWQQLAARRVVDVDRG